MQFRLLKLDVTFEIGFAVILVALTTVSQDQDIWHKLMATPMFAINASTALGLYVLSQITSPRLPRILFATSCGIIIGAFVVLVNTQFEPSQSALVQFITVFLPVTCIALGLSFIPIKTEALHRFTNSETLTDVAQNWHIPKSQWWVAATFTANAAIQCLQMNAALAICTILIVPMQFITADTIFPTPKWYIFTRLMLCFVSMIALILITT